MLVLWAFTCSEGFAMAAQAAGSAKASFWGLIRPGRSEGECRRELYVLGWNAEPGLLGICYVPITVCRLNKLPFFALGEALAVCLRQWALMRETMSFARNCSRRSLYIV